MRQAPDDFFLLLSELLILYTIMLNGTYNFIIYQYKL